MEAAMGALGNSSVQIPSMPAMESSGGDLTAEKLDLFSSLDIPIPSFSPEIASDQMETQLIPEGSNVTLDLDDQLWNDFLPQQDLEESGILSMASSSIGATSLSAPSEDPTVTNGSKGQTNDISKSRLSSVLAGVGFYLELSVDPPPPMCEEAVHLQSIFSQDKVISADEKALYFAMAASGYRMAQDDTALADELYAQAYEAFKQSLEATMDGHCFDMSTTTACIHTLQACNVLVPHAYGLRDSAKAEDMLLDATRLVERFRINSLDGPEASGDPESLVSLINQLKPSNPNCRDSARSCITWTSCADCFREAIRQTWWEVSQFIIKLDTFSSDSFVAEQLYVTNAIFLASTSKAGPREGSVLGLDVSVDSPKFGKLVSSKHLSSVFAF
jgi:hypothetical protein